MVRSYRVVIIVTSIVTKRTIKEYIIVWTLKEFLIPDYSNVIKYKQNIIK